MAAIQVAKLKGAKKVIATTRSSAKKNALLGAGADSVVTTDEEPLVEAIARETGPSGVDVIFDPVAGPWIEQLAGAAAHRARLVIYGILSMDETPFPLFMAMSKGITVRAFHLVFNLLQQADLWKLASEELLAGFESGALKLRIDREFNLAAIRDAYRYLESNQQIGKIVVTTGV
ncbi:MAG: zinc-binding dehydrogenase [Planctomycetota bacterium]